MFYYIKLLHKYCLYKKDYIDSLIEQQRKLQPHRQSTGATQASRRNLHHSSSSHLHPLSSVTVRMSRLMVATQQVKGKI
jgi:hypothetical protein